jgi:hypothetical protein
MSAGGSGGASGAREEEMEEEMEIEEGSSRTVAMPAARGTFIAGTADGTVSEARNSQKRQRTTVNVSEDLLNRQIHEYGLVSPERAKNLVWSYFKKYGRKNLTRGHENLKLQQQALCTICLGDQDRRRHSTVQLGKDNSPSSMMDHLRIHHRDQHDAVVVANNKGLTLAAFNAQRNEPRVRALLGNSTVSESTDISPGTADVTPKTGNVAGASLHEGSMARHAALHTLFQKPSPQEAGAAGPERSITDLFKPSSSWTAQQDKQWKEDLVCCLAEQYLPMAIVDCPAFRSMIQTLNPKSSIPDQKGVLRKMSEMRALMEVSPRYTNFQSPLLYTYQ